MNLFLVMNDMVGGSVFHSPWHCDFLWRWYVLFQLTKRKQKLKDEHTKSEVDLYIMCMYVYMCRQTSVWDYLNSADELWWVDYVEMTRVCSFINFPNSIINFKCTLTKPSFYVKRLLAHLTKEKTFEKPLFKTVKPPLSWPAGEGEAWLDSEQCWLLVRSP